MRGSVPLLNISRRRALQFGLGATIGSSLAPIPRAFAQDVADEDILKFALNLEYMEAEYYLRGTTGAGIEASDAGPEAGEVVGGKKVSFGTPAIAEFMEEVAENELAHVRFYRKTLGDGAVDRPAIDFDAGFAAVAEAAGFGPDFDPFGNEMNFVLGGMLFEDVGVTAYNGAATVLKNKGLPCRRGRDSRRRGLPHGHGSLDALPHGRGSLERGECGFRCARRDRRAGGQGPGHPRGQ